MKDVSEYLVSVIIPVYNAALYIREAVESVIHLQEAGEVLLIDDGSTDRSWAICKELEKKYKKVRVLQHAEGKNLGAAATRNKGIRTSNYEFIAFLDADDYYLPNRFEREKEIFLSQPEVDGVYGCNQAVFENDLAREKFLRRYDNEKTTFTKELPPQDLFRALIFGGYGRFHTSAITLRMRAFGKSGLFNESIRYVEDTELWLKLSLKATLVPGSIDEAISVRRVHDNNSIHQIVEVNFYSSMMYQILFDWVITQPFQFDVKNCFFITLHKYARDKGVKVKKLFWLQVMRHPRIILSSFFYKKIHQLYFT